MLHGHSSHYISVKQTDRLGSYLNSILPTRALGKNNVATDFIAMIIALTVNIYFSNQMVIRMWTYPYL